MNNMFALRKKELPLKDDSGNIFLQTIISIAIFIFTVSLAGVMSISIMLQNWNDSIIGSLTVQIMPVNNLSREDALKDSLIEQDAVIKLLNSLDYVESAVALTDEQLQKLIKPWLGDGMDLSVLPLPRLVDVRIKTGASVNLNKLAEAIAQVSKMASIDSHKMWLGKLIDFADGLKLLAVAVLFLVLLVTAGAIFYTTKTSMGLHKNIIEILHIMGAKDAYIAQQYAKKNGTLGLIGGVIGLLLAIPTIFIISSLAKQIEGGIISDATLSVASWLVIFSIPLFAGLVAMVTAYITVKKTLRKMI